MKKRKKKVEATEPTADQPEAPAPDAGIAPDPAGAHSAESAASVAEDFDEDTAVGAPPLSDAWEGPTHEANIAELAELAAQSVEIHDTTERNEVDDGEEVTEPGQEPPSEALEPLDASPGRLESVIESMLFASDRALTLTELKRLLAERDGKKITDALEALRERRRDSGVQVVQIAGGWHLRTNPENVAWVSRLVAGKPQRLSRAMLETLAIVAYRQPITRPEIDEIRGVDCGPVLKTLLDRGLVRMIGKKEEVGRPILYGTTPEFLKLFSLRDLNELPTLREFHELGAAEMEKVAKVDGKGGEEAGAAQPSPFPAPTPLSHSAEPDEDDELLSELERAAAAAARASATNEAPATAESDPAAPAAPPSSTD